MPKPQNFGESRTCNVSLKVRHVVSFLSVYVIALLLFHLDRLELQLFIAQTLTINLQF